MTVSMAQALSWRRCRHFLDASAGSSSEAVRRLGAVPAWSGDPDLSIRRRLADPIPDAVATAVSQGEVLQSFAFRGAIHLMTPDNAGAFLTLRAAGRQWERSSWQQHYALTPADWPVLRQVVRSAVADGPLSRAELVDAVISEPRFSHLQEGLSGSALLKAFAWQGDLCLGRDPDGQLTFQSLDTVPAWDGLLDLDEAGRHAIRTYLSGYGPATPANLAYWLVEGLSAGRRRVDRWLDELTKDGTVAIVDVDDQSLLHLPEHLDSLAAAEPVSEVTLLPGYDQWVLGPGTKDQTVVPAAQRAGVTRGANLVLHGGVVVGSWKVVRTALELTWSAAAGQVPHAQVEQESERLGRLRGVDLDLTVRSS